MRICFCHSHFGEGGGPITLLTWAKELRKLGCQIEFVGEGGRLSQQVQNEGFLLHLVPPCRHPSIPRAWLYARIARRIRADVLIGVGTFTGMETALAAFLVQIPLLLILNVSPRNVMWPGDARWRFPMVAPAVVVNKAFGDLCVQKYGWQPGQIQYIPQRIDLSSYALQNGSFQDAIGRVCIIRRLDRLKAQGVMQVLEKMEDPLRRSQMVTVTIAGDGEERDALELTVRSMNHRLGREAIRCVGYSVAVPKLLQDHSVVLGSERSAIEALSTGRITFVISNSGEIWPATYDNLDLLAEDNFVGEILAKRGLMEVEADTVVKTALHPAFFSEMEQCRKWILERYDAKVGGQILHNLLSSLIERKQKPQRFFEYLRAFCSMYSAVAHDFLARRVGILAKTCS